MRRFLFRIEWGLTWFTRFSGLVSGVGMTLFIGFVFGNMTARYLFGAGAVWLQELEWYFLALSTMSGIAYAMRYNEHVRIDVFTHNLGRIPRIWLDLVTMLLVAVPTAILILYYSWPYVELSWTRGEGSPNRGGMPWLFLPKGMILVGFVFILAESIRQILVALRRLTFHSRYSRRTPEPLRTES